MENDDPANFVPDRKLKKQYTKYLDRLQNGGDYKDVHCSTFFPTSFKLLLGDLRHLGLIKFDVREISKTYRHEFYVHLKKPLISTVLSDDDFYAIRETLLRKFNRELGSTPFQNS